MRCRDHGVYTRSRHSWNHFSGPSREFQEEEERNTFLLHLPPDAFKWALCYSITQTAQRWELDATLTPLPFTRLPCDVHHKVLRWNLVALEVLCPPTLSLKWGSLQQQWFQSLPSALITEKTSWEVDPASWTLPQFGCLVTCLSACWVAKQQRVQKLYPGLLWTTSSLQRYLDYMKFELKSNICGGGGEASAFK